MPRQKEKRVLSLTLMREYFDAIAEGTKRFEYRECKPYWSARLEGRDYDEVHFRNGYATEAPFMRVQFKGTKKRKRNGEIVYAIALGKMIEMKNYKKR
jgi:hypothetical protein